MITKKKELVSLIISKTLVFMVVVLLVSAFKSVFGSENSLIGVTSVVLMLVMIPIDLTLNPFKNLLLLVLLNLTLGLSAFLVSQSLILGLFLNFTIMAFIGYYFSYELRKPINMLVGLHYILMIVNPVSISQLPLRLVALVAGACMIMAVQILVNKNKLAKSREKIFKSIIESMLIKIDLLKERKSTSEIDETIVLHLNNLKSLSFNSGKNISHITDFGKNTINILFCLDKIDIILNDIKISDKKTDMEFLDTIYNVLSDIKSDKLYICDLDLNTSNEMYKFDFDYAIKTLIEELKKSQLIQKETKYNSNELPLSKEFKKLHIPRNFISIKSTRVAYGIRLGLLVSVMFFIVDLFDIQFGEWIVYTVFALSQPHSEYTIFKSKKRVVGTIIGAIVISILFNLIDDPSIRTLILIASGYIMSYTSDYRDMVVFVTTSAIASASIYIINPNLIILSRLIFIAIGIVVSLIANKFILPRKLCDEIDNLNNLCVQSCSKISEEVLFSQESTNESMVSLLYLVPALLDLRIDYLKQNGLNMDKSFIHGNKVLMNNIYQLYLLNKSNYDCSIELNNLSSLINTCDSLNSIQCELLSSIDMSESINEKCILQKISYILDDLAKLHYSDEFKTDLYQFTSVFS